jgi:hypothetical protein
LSPFQGPSERGSLTETAIFQPCDSAPDCPVRHAPERADSAMMEIIQCLGYHRPTADARAAMSTRSTQKTVRKQRRSMADDVRERKTEEILAVAEALFFKRGYA